MSKYEDGLSDRLHMNVNDWPHQFTKDGEPYQIGEESDGSKDPIMVSPMICIHCQVKYLNGTENRPPDPCPARNKKRELKRILG